GAQVELGAGGCVEQTTVGFHSIMTLWKGENSAPLQKKKVRLLRTGHLQRVRRRSIDPQPLAIEPVYVPRHHRLDWTQAKRLIILEKINTRRHHRIDGQF